MAESSWWEDLLTTLFTTRQETNEIRQAGWEYAGTKIKEEVEREEREAAKSATPSPTPTPTAPPANPNQSEAEQVGTAIRDSVGQIKTKNPLYGNLPDGKVYLGTKNVQRGQNWGRQPQLEDIAEVTAQINEWGNKKRDKFVDLAIDAGLLRSKTKDLDALESIWQSLAIRSAKMWQRGIGVTPWQLLERYGKASAKDGVASGPITTTTVNRTINLTSPREAKALADAALQQRLGRSPTEKETADFLAALRAAEKKEPSVTKTTTTTSGSGTENVSQTSNTDTSGGVNATSFAEEWSLGHNKDEAGSYQALATYMPAFFAALGAPV